MDYFCFIQSVVSYVENRLKTNMDYPGLEKVTGFSLPHIRDVFKTCTKMPLGRYVNYRRVSNAAFEIIHTDKSMLDIALDYGYGSYDTFTRVFKRLTGITPREFRKASPEVGRIRLTAGVFGPGILDKAKVSHDLQLDLEEKKNMKTIDRTEESCVLYGVPKVKYCFEECTPFPSALKACLKYMGQEISYTYLMAVSGAAFRLRWRTTYWDGGNVDVVFIYENHMEVFERSFKAAGRSYRILKRESGVTKEEFIAFIKSEIDEGRPVIALGIIGPPEACIITGYRDNGNTLLGWNFFQENTEFAKDVKIDESGYFICSSWWENPNTISLMSVGEERQSQASIKSILENALEILTKEKIRDHAGGLAAYDEWAKSLSDETEFPKGAVLPMLFERLMCQVDAMTMIGEGRSYAACFMEWVAKQNETVENDCLKAAGYFKREFELVQQMGKHMGGFNMSEKQARKLAEPNARKEIVKLIMKAKEFEACAIECVKTVIAEL